jgi:hypothetical protein
LNDQARPRSPGRPSPDTPALDVAPVVYLHRDPDAYIGFVRKLENPLPGKTFESIGSIAVREIENTLPGIFDAWLTHDGYMTVNSPYRAAPYILPKTGLAGVLRREYQLTRLNACYADIDCGRTASDEPGATLSSIETMNAVELLAHSGTIPQPSMIAHSGRGLYVFWLLRDERNPALPQKAWPEKTQVYKLCNRGLIARLRENGLAADEVAFDAARVLRIPGSIHRKTGNRVGYFIRFDTAGRGYLYTLREMAGFLGVLDPWPDLPPATRAAAIPPTFKRSKKKGTAPLRSVGPKRSAGLRAMDLRKIEQWRGGFLARGQQYPDGTRSYGRKRTLEIYASFLRSSGATREETILQLRGMAARTRPPYPSESNDPPVAEIVRGVYAGKTRLFNNDLLASNFGITPEIARALELQAIRPLSVALEADQARPSPADIVRDRRERLREFVARRGGHATARQVEAWYRLEGLPGANRQTANNDLNAIGCVMLRSIGGRPPRGTAGRPRKEYKGIK